MSAPSKSFTTCCNLKSKEFDFCNKEERDSTTSNISERNIVLAKCGDLVTFEYVLRVLERIGAKCPDPGFQDSTCLSVLFDMIFYVLFIQFLFVFDYIFIILYLDRVDMARKHLVVFLERINYNETNN